MKIIKKILKVIVIVVIAISAILAILALYVFKGASQIPQIDPNQVVQMENDKVDIVFLGDSLASGVYSDGTLIYSSTQMGHAEMIRSVYQDNSKLNSFINYAVPGYQTEDLINDITQNRTFNDVLKNSIINEKSYLTGLNKSDATAEFLSEDVTINDSIKNADIIVINIGANDILNAVSGGDSGIDINYDDFKLYLNQITNNINEIEQLIRKQNPDADVYFYGIYFAMPHYGDVINFVLQPLLKQIDDAIFKGATMSSNPNTHTISIKEHFNAHLKEYVDNPKNIHPNELGYHAMTQYFFKARYATLNN